MGTNGTNGSRLALALIIILIINALVWGVILFIPIYTEFHTISTLVSYFQHPPIVWVFGAVYLTAASTMIAGLVSNKLCLTRVGLFIYVLVNIYRVIGGFLLMGPYVAFAWLPMLTTACIAATLWLHLGRYKT